MVKPYNLLYTQVILHIAEYENTNLQIYKGNKKLFDEQELKDWLKSLASRFSAINPFFIAELREGTAESRGAAK